MQYMKNDLYFHYCINVSFPDRFWPQEKKERSKNSNLFRSQKILRSKKIQKAHFRLAQIIEF